MRGWWGLLSVVLVGCSAGSGDPVGARVDLDQSVIRTNLGIGLAYAQASGILSRSHVLDNAIGVHAQDGTEVLSVLERPDDPPQGQFVVTEDTVFEANVTRVGGGVVPLPGRLDPAL